MHITSLFAGSVIFALSALSLGIDYHVNGVLAYFFDLFGVTQVSSWLRYFIPLLLVLPIGVSGCVVGVRPFRALWISAVVMGLSAFFALFPTSVQMYAAEYIFINDFSVPILTPFAVYMLVVNCGCEPVAVAIGLGLCDLFGKSVFAISYRIDNWLNSGTLITACAVPIVVPVVLGGVAWLRREREPEEVSEEPSTDKIAPLPNWTGQAVLGGVGCILEFFNGIVYPTYSSLVITAMGQTVSDPLPGIAFQTVTSLLVMTLVYWKYRKSSVMVLIVGCVLLLLGTTICACVPVFTKPRGGNVIPTSDLPMAAISTGIALSVPGYYITKYMQFCLIIEHARGKHTSVILSLHAGLIQLLAVVMKALYCELCGFHGIYVGAALFMAIFTIALIIRMGKKYLLVEKGDVSPHVVIECL